MRDAVSRTTRPMTAEETGAASGPHWVTADVQWQREPDRHCTLCGRLLIRTYLADGPGVYCDDDCRRLDRDRRQRGAVSG